MFEKKFDFLELFCLLIMEFYFKKGNFEDNFSAKIKVSGWTKTNMAAASHHPRILSPKYWQAGNVKPLTANRSLSFVVKWPNLDLKVSNKSHVYSKRQTPNEIYITWPSFPLTYRVVTRMDTPKSDCHLRSTYMMGVL